MSKKRGPAKPEETESGGAGRSASPVLLAVAWALPGLGHLLLGRYVRAAVFGSVVLAAFLTGLALSGELATPTKGSPFSYLATAGCIGNGLLYFVSRIIGFGQGDANAAGFSFGNTFLYTAGVMNLLTVLDVSDIATGRKN